MANNLSEEHLAVMQQQQQQQQEAILQQQQQQQPIPPDFFTRYEQQWEKQEQQNTFLLTLVKQLTDQLQQTMAAQQHPPLTPSASTGHPSIHPSLIQPPLPLHSVPSTSASYGRYDDPNRPAPEFPSRIQSFTGNELTLDLDEYLSDIELHFVNKNCPENKKVSSFVGLLKSGARQWAEQYLESRTATQALEWIPFKTAFSSRWRVTHLTTNLRAEIEVLRRDADEPLASFAARYLALANRIPDRSDKDKKLDFARKMPTWFQSRISDLHSEEDSLDAFLHKVVGKEAAIKT
ncbi:hypothetical protein BGZ97_008990, partial [Linnemannia gamsii]